MWSSRVFNAHFNVLQFYIPPGPIWNSESGHRLAFRQWGKKGGIHEHYSYVCNFLVCKNKSDKGNICIRSILLFYNTQITNQTKSYQHYKVTYLIEQVINLFGATIELNTVSRISPLNSANGSVCCDSNLSIWQFGCILKIPLFFLFLTFSIV